MLRSSLALAALLAAPSFAQSSLQVEALPEPAHACVLMAQGLDHLAEPSAEDLDARVERWYAEANPTSQTVVSQGPSATFVVTYTGFEPYPEAQAAYQAAVDIWASHLASNVPIVVTAEFLPLGTGVLGAAGPYLIRNFAGAPQTDVWYPYGIADAIAQVDLVPGAADLQSRFSSNFSNWYFGTDGNPAPNQYDFRHVVLHELGHGLGFSGSGRVQTATTSNCGGENGTGCWGRPSPGGSPQVFDFFVEDNQGVAMLDTDVFPNPSAELGAMLRSAFVWADSDRIAAVAGTLGRAKLWAPGVWQQGSSFSHWDEFFYSRGTPNALMSPQVAPGESSDSPGPLTCAFFADMGWPLGAGCAQFVDAEAVPGATEASALQIVGANPFATSTRLRLTLDAPQTVEAVLYDVTGRRVRTLFDGAAPAGPLTIELRADGLAPGVYAVRAITGASLSEARVVVAR